ncbi:MAG: cytochrome c-type biogenesis protein CcmH [Actinobacteria bacterium]|nr:cytochrome c-type biogenesis protein CcmH [Actinomycetota bacterium]
MTRGRRRGLWIALAVIVVGLLAVGVLDQGERTDAQRARDLEEQVRCPQCRSQSVAQSETPSAKGVKTVIRDQIAAGRSDEEILDYIASAYGREVLLDPPGSGFSGLVWALPAVVAIVAVAGLVVRFRDWRPGPSAVVSGEDRELVAGALASRQQGEGDGD